MRQIWGTVIVGLAAVLLLAVMAVGPHLLYEAEFGGPPLDFDAPRNGQVVAHIDVFGRFPPDIARIRITDVSSHAVVWETKPSSGKSECWNGCWNLTLKAGQNPASFLAGHQQFVSQLPTSETFSLSSGVHYLFEVWDSKGRVERQQFTL